MRDGSEHRREHSINLLIEDFFPSASKDLNLGNSKPVLGPNLAKEFRGFPQLPLNSHNHFHLPTYRDWGARGTINVHLSDGDWNSQPELPHSQKSGEHVPPLGEVSCLHQWPSLCSELEQLHNIYNGMESNMTHISKRKLERDMNPTFLPALQSYASLSLYHKNNKGASVEHNGGGCFRENCFESLKPEIKKKIFKKKNYW